MRKHLLTYSMLLAFLIGCESTDDPSAPVISTSAVTNITATTAQGGGTISDGGASAITERGLVWGKNPSPVVSDNKASSGTGTGGFTVDMTNLESGVKYYVRAYAINSEGTTYGNEVSFTTIINLVSINVTPSVEPPIAKGLYIQFTAEAVYSDNTTEDVTTTVKWATKNIDVVSQASSDGSFLATGVGTTEVVASIDDIKGSFSVTVTPEELVSIEVTADKAAIMPESSQEVSAIGTFTDGSEKDVTADATWTSSDTDVATVDLDESVASVSGIDFGTTTITATIGDISGTLDFTVAIVVGGEWAGGIVFYVDETGEHGLVAAPEDQSDGIVFWEGTWTYLDEPSYTPDTSIGAGESNTQTQVNVQGDGTYAAKLCYDLVLNDHDDWFLPSRDELQLMCQNLYAEGIGNLSDNFYWSSTDISKLRNASWMQFSGGCQLRDDLGRNMENRVRAVRKF